MFAKMLRFFQSILIFFVYVQYLNAADKSGDDQLVPLNTEKTRNPVPKRQQLIKDYDQRLRNWRIILSKIPGFISDVIRNEEGNQTLTHLVNELHTIVQVNHGSFAKEFISEVRNIMLDETAQQNIIRIADTVKDVLLVPDGYKRAFEKSALCTRILFNNPLLKATHIVFMGVQEIQDNKALAPQYNAIFEKKKEKHRGKFCKLF